MGSFLGIAHALIISFLVSVVAGHDSCQNPRVRREWRSFELDERAEWIRAVNCLASTPHDPNLVPSVPANLSLIPPVNESSSFYDDIVYLHMDLNIKIHWTGLFFPWHRYYIQFFENALIEKCGFEGAIPYWDWTIDAPDMYNSPFFDNSSFGGIGGWGDPADDFQIYTGGFKDAIRAYPTPNRIRRNYTLYPFENPNLGNLFANDPNAPPPPSNFMINSSLTKENVEYTVNSFEGNFIAMHAYTESLAGLHPGAHFILGGDMTGTCPNGAVPPACYGGPKWTPNDPVFFMHHAMIDKIWYDWQKKSPKNRFSYGGGSVEALSSFATFTEFPTGLPPYLNFDSPIPGDGLWNVTIWDVMDTTGDTLCYTYA
ncbi:Di-copper centre-containing protein [Thelephora terrestris]|uniref:Di-copper centre-containing protein n=1 Tax=Thelephora terrestris TaxID=56493 RepID=A0A9P6H6N4_9AGAM|nr:Di-copper centre-containing protein [Thelephora terrestris]